MSDPGTRNFEPEAAMTFPWRARVWKCLAVLRGDSFSPLSLQLGTFF